MASNPVDRELPTDRLATADETGRRVYLYPSEVHGAFRKWRNATHGILVFIFLLLPWLRVSGKQLFLFDIAARKFTVFGVTFWAHDAPMLVFIFVGATMILFLITAVWGRIWCGWACPQTVFIDSVFRHIEHFAEGDSVKRRIAASQPVSWNGVIRKAVKWVLFLAASLVITHSFLAYFIDTKELAAIVLRPPAESPVAFLSMLALTGLVLFDFGWFREQFCTIACPYGRFQSFLMDEHSLLIGYDSSRGEPRKGLAAAGAPHGDCINCYRCVQVCPTGIDIRRGLQMECIACTACADACDDVMARLHKPKGLIRYATAVELGGKTTKWIRPRVIAYLAATLAVCAGLAITLELRKPVQATFLRAADAPYTETVSAKGEPLIMNRFKIDLANQSFEALLLAIELDDTCKGRQVSLIVPINPVPVSSGKIARVDLFVTFPRNLLTNGKAVCPVRIRPEDNHAGVRTETEEVTLVGPF